MALIKKANGFTFVTLYNVQTDTFEIKKYTNYGFYDYKLVDERLGLETEEERDFVLEKMIEATNPSPINIDFCVIQALVDSTREKPVIKEDLIDFANHFSLVYFDNIIINHEERFFDESIERLIENNDLIKSPEGLQFNWEKYK